MTPLSNEGDKFRGEGRGKGALPVPAPVSLLVGGAPTCRLRTGNQVRTRNGKLLEERQHSPAAPQPQRLDLTSSCGHPGPARPMSEIWASVGYCREFQNWGLCQIPAGAVGLKQQEWIVSRLEARSWESRCHRAPGDDPSVALPVSQGGWQPLVVPACRHTTQLCVCRHTASCRVSLSPLCPPPLLNTSPVGSTPARVTSPWRDYTCKDPTSR